MGVVLVLLVLLELLEGSYRGFRRFRRRVFRSFPVRRCGRLEESRSARFFFSEVVRLDRLRLSPRRSFFWVFFARREEYLLLGEPRLRGEAVEDFFRRRPSGSFLRLFARCEPEDFA